LEKGLAGRAVPAYRYAMVSIGQFLAFAVAAF
jgi:hypothetical protein